MSVVSIDIEPLSFVFADDGLVPNNPMPFLVYKGAADVANDHPERTIEGLFGANGWGDMWRNGVYDYLHYHATVHEALGIARDNTQGRLDQYKRNFEFFNAPVALFITIERKLGPGQWADLGSYIHTLMYLARGHGLDTCPQESWARMYKTVGAFLKIPPDHMLFCAVAIGYGDHGHPANSFRSPRADLEEFCTFLGFDPA